MYCFRGFKNNNNLSAPQATHGKVFPGRLESPAVDAGTSLLFLIQSQDWPFQTMGPLLRTVASLWTLSYSILINLICASGTMMGMKTLRVRRDALTVELYHLEIFPIILLGMEGICQFRGDKLFESLPDLSWSKDQEQQFDDDDDWIHQISSICPSCG